MSENYKAFFAQALDDISADGILAALAQKEEHQLSHLLRLSVRLKGTGSNGAMGQSKFGGRPDVYSGFTWPEGHDGVPLAFICQLNLTELNTTRRWPLPSRGILYFFYEAKEQPWGFDPYDRGQWRVLYHRRASGLWAADAPEELPDESVFSSLFLKGNFEITLPDGESDSIVNLGCAPPIIECYQHAVETWYDREPWHRLLGHPQSIQGQMEVECEMVSNGIEPTENLKMSIDPSIARGAKQWRLLLQVDSDEETGMLWGDGGRLYFWIKETDLKECKFDDVWVMLQCY